MKAKIRGTNIEVDVQPFYDETGFFAGFQDGYECYRIADLVFPDTPDWDDKTDWYSFRREAAKDVLPAIIDKKSSMCSYGEVVEEAIAFADELIKKLKEDKQ